MNLDALWILPMSVGDFPIGLDGSDPIGRNDQCPQTVVPSEMEQIKVVRRPFTSWLAILITIIKF